MDGPPLTVITTSALDTCSILARCPPLPRKIERPVGKSDRLCTVSEHDGELSRPARSGAALGLLALHYRGAIESYPHLDSRSSRAIVRGRMRLANGKNNSIVEWNSKTESRIKISAREVSSYISLSLSLPFSSRKFHTETRSGNRSPYRITEKHNNDSVICSVCAQLAS